MKLIKQIKLFFKEGKSDKVYEVDLCQVGPDQYVVNFRYGKRGATLKEGTKTSSPVALPAAETVFNGLEMEKRKKGYQSEAEMFQPLPSITATDKTPPSRETAILKRLSALVSGQSDFKTNWKPSRIIWRAGELRLKESVPFLIRLVDRGDEMQRYATLWALGRLGSPEAAGTVQVYFSNHKYTEKIRRIAGEALLHLLQGDEKQAHIRQLESRLPDALRQALLDSNGDRITAEIEKLATTEDFSAFSVIEDLYTLVLPYPLLQSPLLELFQWVPLKPGWFRTIRHIFKVAELRDDFQMQGLLAYRFERTSAFFNKPVESYYYESDGNPDPSVFVPSLNQRIRLKAELRKPESRLAYSDRTRTFFKKRLFRTLTKLGKEGNVNYVRLATGILLSYDKATDYKAPQEHPHWLYDYSRRQYVQGIRRFPAYNTSFLLNWILFGAGQTLEMTESGIWRYRDQQDSASAASPSPAPNRPHQASGGLFSSLFQRISSFLGQQSNAVQSASEFNRQEQDIPPSAALQTPQPPREDMFPELWDRMPQAYMQLLLRARVDEVHAFAYENLLRHPDYSDLEKKMNEDLIRQLLSSSFPIPVRWGVDITRKRLQNAMDPSLVLLLLSTADTQAHKLAKEVVETHWLQYAADSAFVAGLVFSPVIDLQRWAGNMLTRYPLSTEAQQLLVGRAMALLMTSQHDSAEEDERILRATQILLTHASGALRSLSQQVITELLQVPMKSTQALAVRLIIMQTLEPSASTLASLLCSPYSAVRSAGSDLLKQLSHRLTQDKAYARNLSEELIRGMIRKEVSEGMHNDLEVLLRGPLSNTLADLDRTAVLRLVYASFRPAQELGLWLLSTYPHSLTFRQVVALGNHELLTVRQWCLAYFRQNPDRIRQEKDEAIRLLDARWDDTRQGAMQFFRDVFTSDDWSPETLVAIADSVRPDVQAFGRELITRFFADEEGPDYLLRLSQHPDAAVLLFTTNYLERFATDQPERLKALAFYFRSVLLRPHRSRIAKDRIFGFLRTEGLKTEENARFVARLLTDISATSAIGDKATCIALLRDLQDRYATLETPLKIHQPQQA